MTPKDIEHIISQVPELRFQFLIRIQFHLELEMIESFFNLKKSELGKYQKKSKGLSKIIQGYWDLFQTESDSAFLIENETALNAISKMEAVIEKIQLNNKEIKWSEIRKEAHRI